MKNARNRIAICTSAFLFVLASTLISSCIGSSIVPNDDELMPLMHRGAKALRYYEWEGIIESDLSRILEKYTKKKSEDNKKPYMPSIRIRRVGKKSLFVRSRFKYGAQDFKNGAPDLWWIIFTNDTINYIESIGNAYDGYIANGYKPMASNDCTGEIGKDLPILPHVDSSFYEATYFKRSICNIEKDNKIEFARIIKGIAKQYSVTKEIIMMPRPKRSMNTPSFASRMMMRFILMHEVAHILGFDNMKRDLKKSVSYICSFHNDKDMLEEWVNQKKIYGDIRSLLPKPENEMAADQYALENTLWLLSSEDETDYLPYLPGAYLVLMDLFFTHNGAPFYSDKDHLDSTHPDPSHRIKIAQSMINKIQGKAGNIRAQLEQIVPLYILANLENNEYPKRKKK